MKIIGIPFAGGDKNGFRAFKKYIPSGIEWITLELPGRGRRFGSNVLETIEEATQDLLEQLKPLIASEPYMIYGHSMGTLLGYELTKKLIELQLPLPACLYFTGRAAPGARDSEKRAGLPPKQFWEKVKEIGGLPEEILDHAELLELYYPILSADFKMIEEYKYEPLKTPLPVPIFIAMGTDEFGDGLDKTTREQVKMWERETSHPCHFSEVPGNHFFILKHPELVVRKITKAFIDVLSTH
ncbi:thioesterase II family protein [Ascidiimonas sp. W6]|uniref:thioesterase II family protein n=1 Tax=Ascidiimonas meishanensis TaxID=3128903 RepID=UPI0030ECB76C